MLLGGLRAAEVRSLRLSDVDMGLRQVKVVGKGAKQRLVPVDRAFFTELGSYLRTERPPGTVDARVFRGPARAECRPSDDRGRDAADLPDSSHRTGATRVRPHRLRHTYGSELAAAGIDLLVLRELMGHAHAEATAAYVHLAPETVAAEWASAKKVLP